MFIQQLFNGVMLGSTYALIAISFTLLMGILGMLNFAIGEVFMLGAVFGLVFIRLGLPIYWAFLLAIVCAGCVSLVIERFSFRPFRHAPPLVPLLSTIGFSILIQNTTENLWGSERSQFPQWLEPFDIHLGPVLVPSTQLIIFVAAVLLMIGLDLFIQRTRVGRGMRAVAENAETASILGVDSNLIISLTFFVSGALAGASGILFGLSFSIVSPFMGMEPGIKGIAADDSRRHGKHPGSYPGWAPDRHHRGPERGLCRGTGKGLRRLWRALSCPCPAAAGHSWNDSGGQGKDLT